MKIKHIPLLLFTSFLVQCAHINEMTASELEYKKVKFDY